MEYVLVQVLIQVLSAVLIALATAAIRRVFAWL
ncbi:hypothetical protein EDD30_6829 [Couchioplanes caeruleus]|uniref:Uncharacterized protein n=1 Tax=Couchioplanes caeruleus TaxID=56438 RepID=A0A3N1GU83_9ACTN|nr:hypothetical protein EDD30_6829 [Couchioplanes caeruleus]